MTPVITVYDVMCEVDFELDVIRNGHSSEFEYEMAHGAVNAFGRLLRRLGCYAAADEIDEKLTAAEGLVGI